MVNIPRSGGQSPKRGWCSNQEGWVADDRSLSPSDREELLRRPGIGTWQPVDISNIRVALSTVRQKGWPTDVRPSIPEAAEGRHPDRWRFGHRHPPERPLPAGRYGSESPAIVVLPRFDTGSSAQFPPHRSSAQGRPWPRHTFGSGHHR